MRLCSASLEYALAYPPHGVRDELESAGLIELFSGLDEPKVTLVDEVGKAQTLVLVLLGNRHDEAQIGSCELFKRLLVSFAYALGEFNFLFR